MNPDNLSFYLLVAIMSEEMLPAGVKLYRFKPGFMHQKVMLVDDRLAAVGTVNLDNRSFFLNFEITALLYGEDLIQNVREVLEEDFNGCREVSMAGYRARPVWFRAAVRIARLLAPVQ